MHKYLSFIIGILCFTSCDLFDYHPYSGKVSSDIGRDLNNKNIREIESICANKDTIRFIWYGDSGRSLDELKKFVKHVNQQDSIDFAIHAGDMAEFGLAKEYEWGQELINNLKIPNVVIIGNHDIIANGEKVYKKIHGDFNFRFIAGDILFLCLNTNALEYDYSIPVPDFSYIKESFELYDSESEVPTYKRTIVAMHAPPENEQFNNNVKDIFHEKITAFPSLLFCLNGHTHNHIANDFFNDGVLYYACDNIGKRSYLVFTITPDGYTHERVKF